MARKKIKTNKLSNRKKAKRRNSECDNHFWLRVENGLKKFLESPFKK